MARMIRKVRKFGYWQCAHCGTENSGKYAKCLSCAAPVPRPRRGQRSVYYLKPNSPPITDPTELAQKSAGPDWICDHCEASNSDFLRFCNSCGNKRDEADFQRERIRYGEGQAVPSSYKETFGQERKPARSLSPGWYGRLQQRFGATRLRNGLLGGAGLLVVGLIYLFFFHVNSVPVKVTGFHWERHIPIEAFKTVVEEDWSMPSGGRELSRREKFSHYEQVVDHYETQAVTKSRQVQSGSETYTETVDNGDGTFSVETHSRPTYTTEYYTEYEEVPVYRDEPVYRDWITYEIDKWVTDRTRSNTGTDQSPQWPAYKLGISHLGKEERLGEKEETYKVILVTTEKEVPENLEHEMEQAEWEALEHGQALVAKFNIWGKLKRLE